MARKNDMSCTRSSWLFTGATSGDLTLLEWSDCLKMSLIWRTAFFIWFVACFIYNYVIIGERYADVSLPTPTFPLAYLTRWGEVLNLIYATVSFVTVLIAVLQKRSAKDKKTMLETISGFLMEMSSTMSLVIMLLYYAVDVVKWTFGSINAHLLMFVMHLVENFLIRTERRFYHFWPSSIFSLCYLIVNIIIWAVDGITLYGVLNWTTSPGSAAGIAIGVVVAAIPLLHGIWCLLTMVRVGIAGSVKKGGPGDTSVGMDNLGYS